MTDPGVIQVDDDMRPSRLRRFFNRIWDAVPNASMSLSLSFFWGLGMAVSALVALFIRLRTDIITPLPIMAMFFLGGAIGAPVAAFLTRIIFKTRRPTLIFLGMMVFLAASTFAATAIIFALQYRLYYAQWHEPFLTKIWFFQFIFTSGSAVYQFAVFGGHNYWPVGIILLPVFSLWFALRTH